MFKATHQGKLQIGDFDISCAVLEDGTRVLIERSVALAFGIKGSGAFWKKKKEGSEDALLPEYVSAKYLAPYIPEQTKDKLVSPISFLSKTGKLSRGLPAEVLLDICDVWIAAYEDDALSESQKNIARSAYLLVRGFAEVGVVALVDEATGYQYEREKDELQKILEAYIAKEFLPWTKRFPDEFYIELFRLKGWQYRGRPKPPIVGKITNYLVYERLPKGVLDELKTKNPIVYEGGARKYRHHQLLTPQTGQIHLDRHLSSVMTLMRISDNWEAFDSNFRKAFNIPTQLILDM